MLLKRQFSPRSAFLPLLLAAASLTCSGDGVVLPKEGEPANVTVMDGNNQTGTVGTSLAESLVVRITDPSDRPVVGARVRFVLVQPVNVFLLAWSKPLAAPVFVNLQAH